MDRPKRRWRNFLLDARYQLSFTLPMVLLAAALFTGLGYVAVYKTASATKIGLNQLEQTGAYLDDADETRAALLARERVIDIGIVLTALVLCLGLGLYGVVLSHRVAGPLYRLGVELARIRDGNLAAVSPLRKGDHLLDLFERFRAAVAAMREREERDIAVIKQVLDTAGAHPAGEKLQACLRDKEGRLG